MTATGLEDAAILDTMYLSTLVARKVELEGGCVHCVRSELEEIYLEASFVETGGNGHMTITDSRAPFVELAQVTAQEAAVTRATEALRQTEAESAAAIQTAWERRREAQGRLDGRRRALLSRHAEAWREHGEQLAEQAAGCDPGETVTVRVHVWRVDNTHEEVPELRFASAVLLEEAAAAAATADRLDGYAGSHDSAALENTVAALGELPGGEPG
jgi:uncharacterized protein (DUF2235 family)